MKRLALLALLMSFCRLAAQGNFLDSLRHLSLPQAEIYFDQCRNSALEKGDHEELKTLYDQYCNYFEQKGDYRNAYKYHVVFSRINDSLELLQSSSSYGLPLSQKKDPSKTTAADKEDPGILTFNYISGALIISFLLISALLIRSIRQRRREARSKQLLQEQKTHSLQLIEAEEQDRSKIAEALNENIGQQLSAAKMNLSALQSVLKPTDEANREILRNAAMLLDDSVKEVRNVSRSMVFTTLTRSGLVEAVRELTLQMSASSGLEIRFECVGMLKRLDKTREAVLFRVIRELLLNVLKHARAERVDVQIVVHEKELNIMIEDNGIGFDVNAVLEKKSSLGLRNVQSRMAFLNGLVFFDSRPSNGTTVTIELPVF